MLNEMLFSAFVSLAAGGLAGAVFNIWYTNQAKEHEDKALIVAFCSEFVGTYERCVMYLEKSLNNVFSKSTLFEFTDASMLSRYAYVSRNPNVINAILELKGSFFQIGRHIKEASQYTVQIEMELDIEQEKKLQFQAWNALNTGLAFFQNHHAGIETNMKLMIEVMKKDRLKEIEEMTNSLSKRFEEANGKFYSLPLNQSL